MSSRVRVLTFVLCLGGLVGFSAAAFSATIVSQAPCTGASGFCLQFNAGAAIPVIRTITFNAPSAGTAAVSFHG